MGKIAICHVTQFLEIGGLESLILELCKATDRERFDLGVLCLNGYDESYKMRLDEVSVPVRLERKRTRLDYGFLNRAAALLREMNVDIIHSHGGCFLYGNLIRYLAGVKSLIHTVHGLPVRSAWRERQEEFLSCCMADRIVAVSEEVAEDLRNRHPSVENKIEVVINGVDCDRFRPESEERNILEKKRRLDLPTDRKMIGTVGRLEKEKNFPMLIRAIADLFSGGREDIHLTVVGEGVERHNLQNLAADLDIETHVSFLGMRYDLENIYPIFDVFALPSITEGTSLSILESQSCGIPAVVTAVGGNSKIITHSLNGYLCPSGDHRGMAKLIGDLLTDDALMSAMKRNARNNVLSRFDLSSMIREYERIYFSLCRKESTNPQ
jgi:glycosyltransferase involved in cell wall biosynthesis